MQEINSLSDAQTKELAEKELIKERRMQTVKDVTVSALKVTGSAVLSLATAAVFGYVLGRTLKTNAPQQAPALANTDVPHLEVVEAA